MENNENNVQNQEKKQSKGLSVGLVIIMLIATLIIGIGGGYLLSKNDSLFSKNETQSNSTDNAEKNKSENITRNELIEESETKKIFNQINKDNFKRIEIGKLTSDYDYIKKNSTDYQLAQKIITASADFKVDEINAKSLPEMNYIIIYYDNTSIGLHYYIEEDDITITTGEGETFKCWRGSNNDLTNLRTIIDNYMNETQSNQTTSNNTTSATNDIQKYLGKWYDENNSSELDILSIANGYCSFSWGIYRLTGLDNAVIPMKNNSGSFYFQGYDDKNFNSQQDEGEHYYRKATISLNNDSITIKVENIDHANYDITQEKDFPGQVYLTEATYTFKIK